MSGPSKRISIRTHALLWLGQWLVFWAMWILFTAKLEKAELLIGLAAAAVATVGSHVVWWVDLAHLSANGRMIGEIWRVPPTVITGTWTVMKALFRQLFLRQPAGSLLRAVRFDPGGDDGDSATRRALALIYTSLEPNTVVIGIDRKRGLLLFHAIEDQPVQEVTKRLGAKS